MRSRLHIQQKMRQRICFSPDIYQRLLEGWFWRFLLKVSKRLFVSMRRHIHFRHMTEEIRPVFIEENPETLNCDALQVLGFQTKFYVFFWCKLDAHTYNSIFIRLFVKNPWDWRIGSGLGLKPRGLWGLLGSFLCLFPIKQWKQFRVWILYSAILGLKSWYDMKTVSALFGENTRNPEFWCVISNMSHVNNGKPWKHIGIVLLGHFERLSTPVAFLRKSSCFSPKVNLCECECVVSQCLT